VLKRNLLFSSATLCITPSVSLIHLPSRVTTKCNLPGLFVNLIYEFSSCDGRFNFTCDTWQQNSPFLQCLASIARHLSLVGFLFLIKTTGREKKS
jgi:hypothetical protein